MVAWLPFGGLSTARGRDSEDSVVAGDSGDGGDGSEPVVSFGLDTGGGKEAKSACAYSRIDSSVFAEGNEGETKQSIQPKSQVTRKSKKKKRTRRYPLDTQHILPRIFRYLDYLRLRTGHTDILPSTNRPQQVIWLQRTAN